MLQVAQIPPLEGFWVWWGEVGCTLNAEKIPYLLILLIPPSKPRGAGIQATGNSMLANAGSHNDIGALSYRSGTFYEVSAFLSQLIEISDRLLVG